MKILEKIFARKAQKKWKLRDAITVTIDPQELREYLESNDGKERQFPLAVALQLSDAMDHRTMRKERMDALDMTFARGYRSALKDFGLVFSGAITARQAHGRE